MSSLNMTAAQEAMLAGGILLFLAALGLIIQASRKGTPITALISLLLIAVVMIGFPAIQSMTLLGLTITAKTTQDFAANPNNAALAAPFTALLDKVPVGSTLSPGVREGLESTLSALNRRSDLNPKAKAVQARIASILGQTPPPPKVVAPSR